MWRATLHLLVWTYFSSDVTPAATANFLPPQVSKLMHQCFIYCSMRATLNPSFPKQMLLQFQALLDLSLALTLWPTVPSWWFFLCSVSGALLDEILVQRGVMLSLVNLIKSNVLAEVLLSLIYVKWKQMLPHQDACLCMLHIGNIKYAVNYISSVKCLPIQTVIAFRLMRGRSFEVTCNLLLCGAC